MNKPPDLSDFRDAKYGGGGSTPNSPNLVANFAAEISFDVSCQITFGHPVTMAMYYRAVRYVRKHLSLRRSSTRYGPNTWGGG